MTFFCNGCLKDRDFSTEYGILIITCDKEMFRYCKECRKPKTFVPDVYWDGKPEENLADDPHTGKPPVFLSKAHKAAYLQEHGLREAGDRYHGAPFTSINQGQKVDTRHEVRKALQQVKQMGKEYRKQEYQRIMKERERYA